VYDAGAKLILLQKDMCIKTKEDGIYIQKQQQQQQQRQNNKTIVANVLILVAAAVPCTKTREPRWVEHCNLATTLLG